MNILIPDQWLREHLQSEATPNEIQRYLSLCGPSVEKIEEKELSDGSKDAVYDIEITTNRVDSMSVRGIAREASTILKRFGLKAKLKDFKSQSITPDKTQQLPLPEIIYQSEDVKRVLAVVLDQIEHLASPKYMQQRLENVDIGVHEAAIDITNYVTHELGHPCHAFDYDKIMALGGKIIIREAQKGQKFVTLDGGEYQTLGGEIIFTNPKGEIIDLPAVKGTLNTAVDNQTKRILFWIESLDAKKVRFASMSHAIRTVAAQLNEKNVDPHLALMTMEYGVSLFRQHCHAKVASTLYDYFPNKKEQRPIKVPLSMIDNYLGIELSMAKIRQILTDLDFVVSIKTGEKKIDRIVTIQAPTFRQDIEIKADIIEEIARIYGYHNLPSCLMTGPIPTKLPEDDFSLENKAKNFLANIGWQEIYSYSLVGDEELAQSTFKKTEHLKLANPLKAETSYLRRSLLPSLQAVMKKNPQENSLSLFELAFTYQPKANDLPEQNLQLALLSNRSYRQVKGDLYALFEKLYLFNEDFKLEINELGKSEIDRDIFKQFAQLKIKDGRKKELLGQLVIYPNQTVGLELNWQLLSRFAHKHPSYQRILHTAVISEDLTFTLPSQARVGDLIESILKLDQQIKSVELTSIYHQNFSFKVNYQDDKQNIDGLTVEKIRKKLIEMAKHDYQAALVGQS